MRKQLVILALAGTLGVAGGTLLSPGLANADDTPGTAGPVASRLTALKDALKGLVSDDTLTQAQADKVATTLAEKLPARGPGNRPGHGPRGGAHLSPEATATAAGVTVAELRTGREAGKSLAQIAAGKGVSKQTLVDRLVAAKKTALAADVKAGEITQAQADAVSEDLVARTTEQVDRVGGPGDGPRGHRGGPDGDHDGDGPDAPAPNGTATPAPQSS